MSFFWSSPFLFPCPFSEAHPSVSMSFFRSSPFPFACPSTPEASPSCFHVHQSLEASPSCFNVHQPLKLPFLFPCPFSEAPPSRLHVHQPLKLPLPASMSTNPLKLPLPVSMSTNPWSFPSYFHVLFLKLPLPVCMSINPWSFPFLLPCPPIPWSFPFLFPCPPTLEASLPVSMSFFWSSPSRFHVHQPLKLPLPVSMSTNPGSFPFLFPCPPTPGQQPSLFELSGSFLHHVMHHSRARLPAESVNWWGNHQTQQAFLNPGENAAFTQFPGVCFSQYFQWAKIVFLKPFHSFFSHVSQTLTM